MIPLFFGSGDAEGTLFRAPLFGVYRPAAVRPGKTPCGVAVAICSPCGEDYVRSTWLLRVLSEKLSDRGIPSLRFDFRGTGDSLGEPSVAGWREDVRCAEVELRRQSGLEKIVFCGLRLGATFAFLEGREQTDCPLVVLWDPILSGRRYLAEREDSVSSGRERYARSTATLSDSESGERCGFRFSEHFRHELEELELARDRAPVVPPLVLISSSVRQEYDAFAAFHRGRMAVVRRETFNENFSWLQMRTEPSLIAPGKAVDAVAALIEEEVSSDG